MKSSESSSTPVLLSVVIPCYNHGEYLLEAIASVEACLDPVYEIVIVNDGSTDPLTLNVMRHLTDQGYFVLNQENQGLATARNNGIEKAQGRYILTLDADNKIFPDYLLKGIEILEHYPDVGVVYGKPKLFGEAQRSWEIPEAFDANKLILDNYIDACAVFRKSLWQECGGYDPNMPLMGLEDWDFWLSAIEHGWKFHYIPEVLYEYRIRAESMIAACAIPENRAQLLRYVYTKHIKLYRTCFPQVIEHRERLVGSLQRHIETFQAREVDFLAQIDQLGQTALQRSQSNQQLQTQLQQTQAASATIQAELENTRSTLERSQTTLEHSQATIKAMESSKFWQIRQFWMRCKRVLIKGG